MAHKVLVTGGAGYIGSHTVVELLQAGFEVVVLDNLSNASPEALRRVEQITGRRAPLVEGDLRDEALLLRLLAEHRFDATIHFAGLKAVGESVARPLAYYDNNVAGTVTLLRCLDARGRATPGVQLVGHRLRRSAVGADPRGCAHRGRPTRTGAPSG